MDTPGSSACGHRGGARTRPQGQLVAGLAADSRAAGHARDWPSGEARRGAEDRREARAEWPRTERHVEPGGRIAAGWPRQEA